MCSYQPTPAISTDRLTLRPLRKDDAAWVACHAADLDVARMTTRMPHPYSLSDAEGFIESLSDPLACDQAVFAVEAAGEGIVGVIGFHDHDGRGTPEMGYWLAKPFWGRGYATEASRAALAWAKTGWGRKVVFAGHFADNPASAGVLIKAGFLYTGEVKPLHSVSRGVDVDTRMMVWLA
jgi:RimJ/RimL family protein N-acetyltransferase